MPAAFETISVSALNRYVKGLLESDEVLSQVWVKGELSSVKIHAASGHIYFSVIDRTASVKAVMFRSYASRLRFTPQDGMKVILNCQVSLYERDGAFQIYVRDMIPKGQGNRQTELDQLKDRLEKEGLFAPERKRRLPADPRRILILSSASGAAIHDVESVAQRRDPFCRLLLYPVNVQGALAVGAMREAAAAINSGAVDADLCIVTRGGGSRDDLWVFNDESLARAFAGLRIPFISAVGHEVDVTVLDLVADVRAATPSSAAEIALPDKRLLLRSCAEALKGEGSRMQAAMNRRRELLDGLADELRYTAGRTVADRKRLLRHAEELTDAASPFRLLDRGFGYVTTENGKVTSVSDVTPGEEIRIRVRDGRIAGRVTEIEHG